MISWVSRAISGNLGVITASLCCPSCSTAQYLRSSACVSARQRAAGGSGMRYDGGCTLDAAVVAENTPCWGRDSRRRRTQATCPPPSEWVTVKFTIQHLASLAS